MVKGDEDNDGYDDNEDNDDNDDAWSKRKLSIFRGTRAVAMAASFSVKAVPDIENGDQIDGA